MFVLRVEDVLPADCLETAGLHKLRIDRRLKLFTEIVFFLVSQTDEQEDAVAHPLCASREREMNGENFLAYIIESFSQETGISISGTRIRFQVVGYHHREEESETETAAPWVRSAALTFN